jgi:hypothetical protein
MAVVNQHLEGQSGEGGIHVIPLPPPPPARLVSVLFALAAAVAGFLGFSRTAAVFASISLGTNVLDYVTRQPAAAGERAVKTTPVG